MTFLTLKNGPTLPEPAVALAIDLDLRGIRLAAEGPMLRAVGPHGKPDLSQSERDAITLWKPHLLALVAYCAEDH